MELLSEQFERRSGVDHVIMDSPVGRLFIGQEAGAIVYLTTKAPPEGKEGDSALLREAAGQLQEYFEGERTEFTLPLAPRGTLFQKAVWAALCKVPYGQTVSYGQLAALAGRPKAARAVGSAMAQNPIAIIQPCHRVLPAGGGLGYYSMGGPANKEWLLLLERQNRRSL